MVPTWVAILGGQIISNKIHYNYSIIYIYIYIYFPLYSHYIKLYHSISHCWRNPSIFPPWWSPCQASRHAPPAPGSDVPPGPGATFWSLGIGATTSDRPSRADKRRPRFSTKLEAVRSPGSFTRGSTKLLESPEVPPKMGETDRVVCKPPVQFCHLGTKTRPQKSGWLLGYLMICHQGGSLPQQIEVSHWQPSE